MKRMHTDSKTQDAQQAHSAFAKDMAIAAFSAVMLVTGCAAPGQAQKSAATSHNAGDARTQAAQHALSEIFQAYASGKPFAVDAYLDPAMIDYQGLLDNIRDTQNQQKQINIAIKDVQAVSEGGTVQIQLNWEKRYLALPNMAPKLASGQASFHMKLSSKGWRLAGIGGDNVFAAQAK
jgi:hypothetical protein